MTTIFSPVSGQSNYDILMQNYGNPDYFIKMLNDSGVVISSIQLKSYVFDSDLNEINSNFIGVSYATGFQYPPSISEGIVLTQDNGFVLTQDGGMVLTQ